MASNGLKMAQIGLEWPKIASQICQKLVSIDLKMASKWPLNDLKRPQNDNILLRPLFSTF